MKKLTKAFIILFIFSAIGIYSQPRLVIAVTGGYNLPLPQLKGTIDSANSESSESYFMKTGYHLGATGKVSLDKKRRVRLTFGGSYNKFSGTETYNHTNIIDYHTNMEIFSTNIGMEYSFTPKEKTAPFVGVDFTGNFLSGKTEITVTDATPKDHDEFGTTTSTLESATRFGISLGGGVDVAFNKSVGAVFGVKYHFTNLFNKQYNDTPLVSKYYLNDKENGTVKAKNIMFFQIYLGFTFYLDQLKKAK